MSQFHKSSQLEDYRNRSERLCIPFTIVHNATPASKTNSNDLPACLTLSLEGQTATAIAIDPAANTNFTTETDSTGVFGILLSNLGTVSKLQSFGVDNLSAGTVAVTAVGASSTGVTAKGNIALSVDWSGNLATTDLTGTCTVNYIISKA